jgi:hypothetical protein
MLRQCSDHPTNGYTDWNDEHKVERDLSKLHEGRYRDVLLPFPLRLV